LTAYEGDEALKKKKGTTVADWKAKLEEERLAAEAAAAAAAETPAEGEMMMEGEGMMDGEMMEAAAE